VTPRRLGSGNWRRSASGVLEPAVGDSGPDRFDAARPRPSARLQALAAGGEVVVSARLAAFLDHPPGELEQLEIKGQQDPVPAYRARWFATDD